MTASLPRGFAKRYRLVTGSDQFGPRKDPLIPKQVVSLQSTIQGKGVAPFVQPERPNLRQPGEGGQPRSTTIATALPPPRHSDASPRLAPRCCIAYSRVVSTLAPDAPIGCPSATAPPWTFTFASSNSSPLPQASIWAANASFSSNRSMSGSLS